MEGPEIRKEGDSPVTGWGDPKEWVPRPDEVIVVKMGSVKWKTYVNEELVCHKDANELVYSYVLAFDWRDFNSLGYTKSILPYIYDALSVEKLSYSSWKKIEPFTGSVPF